MCIRNLKFNSENILITLFAMRFLHDVNLFVKGHHIILA